MATIKTELELDSSQFKESISDAKVEVKNMGDSVDSLADQLNDAAKAEDVQKASLKNLKKEFAQQKAYIQDCVIKMKALGDAAKDTAAYKKLQEDMENAKKKALEMKESLDAAKDSVSDLTDKKVKFSFDGDLGDLTSLFSSTGLDVSGLESKINSLSTTFQKMNKVAGNNGLSFNTLSGGIKKVISDANQGKGALGQLNTLMSNTTKNCGALGKAFSNLGIVGKLGWIGATVAALTALTKVMSEAVSASADFGQSMSELGALTGVSGDAFDNMRAQVQNVANDTGTLSKEVAGNFGQIGSALPELLKNAEGLEAVSRSAITLSKAGLMPLADATESLTSSMAQFNLGAESAGYATDVLANASQLGSATIAQVADTLKNCGTAANTAGVNLQEAAAAAEVLATKGLKGAEAGTQLKTMFSKMQTSGIDELNPKVVGLSKAIQNLGKYQNNAAFMNKTFGESASQAATILAQNSAAYDDLVGQLDKFGTASEMAIKNEDNLNSDLAKLSVTWSNLMSSFNVDEGLGAHLFREPIQAVTILIDALGELIHAFDGLFAMNETDIIEVSPLKDAAEVIRGIISFVSKLIKFIADATKTGQQLSTVLTALSAVFGLVKEAIDWVNYGLDTLIKWWTNFANSVKSAVAKIPLIEYMKKAIHELLGWIKSLINAYKKMKAEIINDSAAKIELHLEGKSLDELEKYKKKLEETRNQKLTVKGDTTEIDKQIEAVQQLIDKKKEAANTDVWNQTYAKGSLSDIEAQIQKLIQDVKDGVSIYTEEEFLAELKRLQKLKEQIEKTSGLNKAKQITGSGSKKSGQDHGAKGSLTNLEYQKSELEKNMKSGKLKISTEEAQKKIKTLDEQIRKKKIELGITVEGSLSDLESKLSDLQTKYKNGTITLNVEEYKKQVSQLESDIEKKKIELGIQADPSSITGLEAQISKLQQQMQDGTLDISVDEARQKINKLEDELRAKKIEMHLEFPENTGEYIKVQLDKFVEEYKMGLHPEISPEEFKKKVKELERSVKSANIKLGIDLDLDKAEKDLQKLLDDFKKQQQGSSFDVATGNVKTVSNATNNEEKLEAIKAEMDMNDNLINQLQEQLEKFEEMGDAGSEAYQKIKDKIDEVQEAQDGLAEQAKDTNKQVKAQKKQEKAMEGTADAIGSMGDAFSSLGSAFEMPELNAAGIIAGSIASVIQGYSTASAQASSMGPWAWIAFAAAGLAQVAAVIASIHQLSGFAQGGIINSSSRVGDNGLVRVNGGEMIMNSTQQQRLWNIISGENSVYSNSNTTNGMYLESRISGRDLVLCLKNNEKQLNKTGHSISLR